MSGGRREGKFESTFPNISIQAKRRFHPCRHVSFFLPYVRFTPCRYVAVLVIHMSCLHNDEYDDYNGDGGRGEDMDSSELEGRRVGGLGLIKQPRRTPAIASVSGEGGRTETRGEGTLASASELKKRRANNKKSVLALAAEMLRSRRRRCINRIIIDRRMTSKSSKSILSSTLPPVSGCEGGRG